MNYASDPIWWRLRKTIVRDLASLLTAPSPWLSSTELPVSTLLGDEGFRFLLSLDEEPNNLYLFLKQHGAYHTHLGVYAERLLYYWFLHAPHSRLIAHNLPVQDNQRTLGAFDFIVQLNNQIFHLELTCKYYGGLPEKTESFIGLNKADRLIDKMYKIEQQLALSTKPAAKSALKNLSLEPNQLQHASIIRGMLFKQPASQNLQVPLNPLCWQGQYIENWSEFEFQEHYRFHVLDHLSLISPVRVSSNAIVNFNQIKQIQQGMIALVQQHADGYWHEVERIMKTTKHS
ncbi:DUF1853 family protein [Snodgrassella alvi]|jgi:uncharacterized protein|uniref:DUF1853 domain-containing protein n=1 Tax=Snodgrassella alvi TaxID=1196083 RepID=A0A855FUG0_9NEIS|nr:DUF1853 family protein [Snodgrassella alvi]PIT28203.1 hypothetical protein BGI37_01045 [Snodgrassella alvi]PIT49721.1 hypothetical protein BHC51_02615 [Snodgrassella alvi]PIT60094.1 hypothetical protein BHC57_07530 [Snodgrassella alvi]